LAYRDAEGAQRILVLNAEVGERLVIGRGLSSQLCLSWDPEVSRSHAELQRTGDQWTLSDDGMSKNGTSVNNQRLVGRRRLMDGDVIRLGNTTLWFQAPTETPESGTTRTGAALSPVVLTPAQRRVLMALCRPVARSSGFSPPATNQQIAEELFLSKDVIKSHLRALFDRFEIEPLPQNAKRARLVQVAFESGVVSQRELRDP
jgi:predicted component of type VI protein secretion system